MTNLDYPPPTTPPTGAPTSPPQPQSPPPLKYPPVQVPPVVRKKKGMSAGAIVAVVLGSVTAGFVVLCLMVSLVQTLATFSETEQQSQEQPVAQTKKDNKPATTPKREAVWQHQDDTGYYWAEANGALKIMGVSRISHMNEWSVNGKNVSGRELFKVDITTNFESGSDYTGFMYGVTEQTISPNQEFSMRMTCPDPDIDSYLFLHEDTDNPLGSVCSCASE